MNRLVPLFLVLLVHHSGLAKDTLPLQSKTQPQLKTPTPVEEAQPYVASIAVFGSTRINETVLKQVLGRDLQDWLTKGLKGDESALRMEVALAKKIKDKFDLAYAEWTIMQFFEESDLAIHMTLDVVEKADIKRRMPFRPEPTEIFPDPDGLLAAWRDYEETALDLVEAGVIKPDTEKCPAVHCPFGHSHQKLKKFEKIFSEGVKKNQKVLVDILNRSKSLDDRASAAYLLAYLNEPEKVAPLLIPAIRDPDALVRNNVLRVFGDIAEKYPQVVLPIRPFLEAIEFPRTSDRSKSVYVVMMMSMGSQQVREEILRNGIPALLAMLKGNQPDQRDFSHNILRKVSGKDFPVTDYLAWNNWYQKTLRERGPIPEKNK